jgi:hypothetical protein
MRIIPHYIPHRILPSQLKLKMEFIEAEFFEFL